MTLGTVLYHPTYGKITVIKKAYSSVKNAVVWVGMDSIGNERELDGTETTKEPKEKEDVLSKISMLKGEKGDKGNTGPMGPRGFVGPKGEKGDKGDSIRGEKGDKGDDGQDGKDGNDGKRGLRGLTGSKGKDGKDGKDGKKGDSGKDGKDGLNGLNGTNGGGGIHKIDDATDVKITNPTDNQSLTYDADSKKWVNETVSGSGSTAWGSITGTLADQTDVQTAIDAKVSDTAYNATTWDGVTTIAPSKNAVRDKIEAMLAAGGITRTIVVTSGSITLGASANTDYTYFVAGAHTLSMPSPNTNRYTLKNNHSANITIDTAGAELIEGAASIAIAPQESVDILSDGTNWYVE